MQQMLKILSLFSGIGAFEKALENLGVDHELTGFCEIDKYAAKSYCAIHNVDESMNLGDITKVDETKLPKDLDILTYGFPCQDISIAGKQKGLIDEDGTLTRSGLFFDALRIIEATNPKIAIAENVKNLVGKKFNAQFQVVLASLESAGYNNYWKVLNAKDYGVPQNRERVFIVSIRKDIDTGLFEFPEPFPLEKRLKDVLEAEVDEKYYLSADALKGLIARWVANPKKTFKFRSGDDIAATLDTGVGIKASMNFIIQVGQMYPNSGNPQAGRIYDVEGICPSLDTCSGGNRMPKIKELMTSRIRKLTPKECFRLMGFDDESFHRAEVTNSNTQLYKQAGNSIVVDVLEELFCMMLDEDGHLYV
jgi:DNA (cytosine-5)-methyltransferase 1